MKHKAKSFFVLLMLAGCGLMANAVGQSILPPNIGPLPFVLNGSSGTFTMPNLNGQSYCTVTVPSTATMGSGTITMKVSGDNGANWFAVTGLPDLGSGASPSQTITVAGTQLTAPVSGKTGFQLVLSGATGAVISGSVTCALGSGATGSNSGSSGGGSSNATIVAPTNTAGQVLTHDTNPVQPSPLYTQPVTTAAPYVAPTCPVAPNAPCVQLTGPPAPQPSPLYTMPVTTPPPYVAPSQSPWPWPAFVPLHPGSGTTLYGDTWPDTIATSGTISTATTTELVAGTASQTMYVFFVQSVSTGTNTTSTSQLEYGQGATCGTNTVTVNGSGVANGAAAGNSATLYGGTGGTTNNVFPAAIPIIVPANATAYNLCVITAGTTTAVKVVTMYAIHAN